MLEGVLVAERVGIGVAVRVAVAVGVGVGVLIGPVSPEISTVACPLSIVLTLKFTNPFPV